MQFLKANYHQCPALHSLLLEGKAPVFSYGAVFPIIWYRLYLAFWQFPFVLISFHTFLAQSGLVPFEAKES